MPVRLVGYVIHGNNRDTLADCVSDLRAICDRVVAVDSGSTDGSRELAQSLGAESVCLPWQGYGAARARAAELLGSDFDYAIHLDADEKLAEGGRAAAAAWRASNPSEESYWVAMRDWAVSGDGRFVFRTHHRTRIFRRDRLHWSRRMIIHETIPALRRSPSGIAVDHLFDWGDAVRPRKNDRYALLWAIQAHAASVSPKVGAIQRGAHFAKDLLLKGAWWRGGPAAARLAWETSRYHQRKHEFLRAVRRGGYARLVELYSADRLEELFREVDRFV